MQCISRAKAIIKVTKIAVKAKFKQANEHTKQYDTIKY